MVESKKKKDNMDWNTWGGINEDAIIEGKRANRGKRKFDRKTDVPQDPYGNENDIYCYSSTTEDEDEEEDQYRVRSQGTIMHKILMSN